MVEHYYIMKRTFKQWLSTFPSVSQKRTMASHLNWTHWIQKRRPRPGFNRNTNVARLNQFIGSVTLRYSNSSNIYNENEDIMWICRVIKGKSFVNDIELQYTARERTQTPAILVFFWVMRQHTYEEMSGPIKLA
jgi:hypothetical protein